MSPKVISTIVEGEVVYLSEADVEFVSLVRHGANRTPFKILKSENKGGNSMSKIISAVLIPKSLTEELVQKQLEGYRADEVKEFTSYNSYIQVAEEALEAETAEVIVLDKETGVLGIISSLKDDTTGKVADEDGASTNEDGDSGNNDVDDSIDPKRVEKDSVDYATLDDLYMELYAMADIVSGAMRQSESDVSTRSETILKAIDNFKTFAEMLLTSLKEEDVQKFDVDKILEKISKARKSEDDGGDLDVPAIDIDSVKTSILSEVDTMIKDQIGASLSDVSTKVEEVSGAVKSVSDKVSEINNDIDALKPLIEKVEFVGGLPVQIDGIIKDIDVLKNTPLTMKSNKEEEVTTTNSNKTDFTGTLFSIRRSQSGTKTT